MKYFKLTMNYIKQNALMTLIYALLPSVLFAFFVNPCSVLEYNFKDFGPNGNVVEIYKKINDIASVKNFFIISIIFIISVIAFSSMIGAMHRKMRFGKMFNLKGSFFTRVNGNFLSVFKAFVFVVFINLLFGLLMTLFIFFWESRFGVLAMIAVPITYVVLYIILATILIWLMLSLPIMTMRGFKLRRAMKESLRIVGQDSKSFVLGIAFPLLVIYIPMAIISMLDFAGQIYVALIIRILFYMCVFTYSITYCYTSFFELEQIEREDLRSYF